MTEDTVRRLEERLAVVEAEVQRIKTQLRNGTGTPWWVAISGESKDNPFFDEMVKEMQKLRRADRAAARAAGGKTKPPRKPAKKKV